MIEQALSQQVDAAFVRFVFHVKWTIQTVSFLVPCRQWMRAARSAVQLPVDGKHRIANRLSFQAASLKMPEVSVGRVD